MLDKVMWIGESFNGSKEINGRKIMRMQILMKTMDKTIQHLQEKQIMDEHEIFKGFEPDSEQQKKYEAYVEEYLVKKYGGEVLQHKRKVIEH